MNKKGKKSVLYYYDHMEEIFLFIITLIMVAVIFLQVIMRYVFNNSLAWSEEVGRWIFIWMSWIGVSLGAKYGQHIKIEMIVNAMPFKTRYVVNIISELIVIAINILCVVYGYRLVGQLISMGAKSAPLQISQGWCYAAVPVGCAMMILRNIQSIIASIKCMREGEPQAEPKTLTDSMAPTEERGLE
jgi:TRAP-type C4-dicarboxylate transport system permease small subunit